MGKMTVYHGSYLKIEQPKIISSQTIPKFKLSIRNMDIRFFCTVH